MRNLVVGNGPCFRLRERGETLLHLWGECCEKRDSATECVVVVVIYLRLLYIETHYFIFVISKKEEVAPGGNISLLYCFRCVPFQSVGRTPSCTYGIEISKENLKEILNFVNYKRLEIFICLVYVGNLKKNPLVCVVCLFVSYILYFDFYNATHTKK